MILDLFRGPGGWCTGLRMLGITDVHGIDNDEHAHATAIAAGHTGELADITTLDPRDYIGELISGQIGSAPCPGFSPAGLGEGRKDLPLLLTAVSDLGRGIDPATVLGMVRAWQHDERSALTLEPLHWALTLRPSWIALEQVRPVLPIWDAYAAVLRDQGYNVWTGIVHAEQYGVPQTRRRAVLLASLNRTVGRPAPTHSTFHQGDRDLIDPGTQPWVSMADSIGWGMTHRPAMTVTGGGIAKGGPEPFGNAARKGILRERNAGRWIDHNKTTRITVEEAALLQTFPADYPWHGGLGQQFQAIGNAVPPLLAAHLIAELGVGTLPTTNNQLLASA
jgi:DNA (cytosine-5)-methyltransferase 1